VPVSPHLVADDRDGRCEHEDDKARGHADAGQCCDDGADDYSRGRAQQRQMEGIEASDQIVVEDIDQSKKATDRHRDSEDGRQRADSGLVLDEIRGDMKARARSRRSR
jgi:hypothetical protein